MISEADGNQILEGFVTTGAPGECFVSVDVIAGEPGMVRMTLCAGESVCDGDMVIVGEDKTDDDIPLVGEPSIGDAWQKLWESGYFDRYSEYADVEEIDYTPKKLPPDIVPMSLEETDDQIDDRGGSNQSDDGTVRGSKTIAPTELENVFDITLKVETTQKIEEISKEPDMAVVIVMDISNTMTYAFGNTTRYKAAMEAAEQFIDNFAKNNSLGVSKIGYVAFNTDAQEIFDLQSCTTAGQATKLKGIMNDATKKIITVAGYGDSHSRFTNIEAGLKMASDMLSGATNEHKYIIFLSDGFPTTYISSGYEGYDTYDGNRFRDRVRDKPCLYGTSYSDEAAIRARTEATEIKNSGISIFSIGIDVGGQTIKNMLIRQMNLQHMLLLTERVRHMKQEAQTVQTPTRTGLRTA